MEDKLHLLLEKLNELENENFSLKQYSPLFSRLYTSIYNEVCFNIQKFEDERLNFLKKTKKKNDDYNLALNSNLNKIKNIDEINKDVSLIKKSLKTEADTYKSSFNQKTQVIKDDYNLAKKDNDDIKEKLVYEETIFLQNQSKSFNSFKNYHDHKTLKKELTHLKKLDDLLQSSNEAIRKINENYAKIISETKSPINRFLRIHDKKINSLNNEIKEHTSCIQNILKELNNLPHIYKQKLNIQIDQLLFKKDFELQPFLKNKTEVIQEFKEKESIILKKYSHDVKDYNIEFDKIQQDTLTTNKRMDFWQLKKEHVDLRKKYNSDRLAIFHQRNLTNIESKIQIINEKFELLEKGTTLEYEENLKRIGDQIDLLNVSLQQQKILFNNIAENIDQKLFNKLSKIENQEKSLLHKKELDVKLISSNYERQKTILETAFSYYLNRKNLLLTEFEKYIELENTIYGQRKKESLIQADFQLKQTILETSQKNNLLGIEQKIFDLSRNKTLQQKLNYYYMQQDENELLNFFNHYELAKDNCKKHTFTEIFCFENIISSFFDGLNKIEEFYTQTFTNIFKSVISSKIYDIHFFIKIAFPNISPFFTELISFYIETTRLFLESLLENFLKQSSSFKGYDFVNFMNSFKQHLTIQIDNSNTLCAEQIKNIDLTINNTTNILKQLGKVKKLNIFTHYNQQNFNQESSYYSFYVENKEKNIILKNKKQAIINLDYIFTNKLDHTITSLINPCLEKKVNFSHSFFQKKFNDLFKQSTNILSAFPETIITSFNSLHLDIKEKKESLIATMELLNDNLLSNHLLTLKELRTNFSVFFKQIQQNHLKTIINEANIFSLIFKNVSGIFQNYFISNEKINMQEYKGILELFNKLITLSKNQGCFLLKLLEKQSRKASYFTKKNLSITSSKILELRQHFIHKQDTLSSNTNDLYNYIDIRHIDYQDNLIKNFNDTLLSLKKNDQTNLQNYKKLIAYNSKKISDTGYAYSDTYYTSLKKRLHLNKVNTNKIKDIIFHITLLEDKSPDLLIANNNNCAKLLNDLDKDYKRNISLLKHREKLLKTSIKKAVIK